MFTRSTQHAIILPDLKRLDVSKHYIETIFITNQFLSFMNKFFYNVPLFLAVVFTGCQKEISEKHEDILAARTIPAQLNAAFVNTFFGSQVEVGSGKLRSFVRINHENVPQEIGLELTQGALQNLPLPPAGVTGEYSFDFEIPLHQKALEVTPFDHLEFDWQPNGHPPQGIFTLPHFDMHFYMLPLEQQMAIPAPNSSNLNTLFGPVPIGYLPADYSIAGAPVMQMGRHWLDKTSSVLAPTLATFQHELIYGTYDGKVVFLEPMVTRNFLLSDTEFHQAIKQPTVFNPTGTYYPTRYNIYKDVKTGNIFLTLDQFILR
jgi:hypothetical protein